MESGGLGESVVVDFDDRLADRSVVVVIRQEEEL